MKLFINISSAGQSYLLYYIRKTAVRTINYGFFLVPCRKYHQEISFSWRINDKDSQLQHAVLLELTFLPATTLWGLRPNTILSNQCLLPIFLAQIFFHLNQNKTTKIVLNFRLSFFTYLSCIVKSGRQFYVSFKDFISSWYNFFHVIHGIISLWSLHLIISCNVTLRVCQPGNNKFAFPCVCFQELLSL